MKEGESRKGGGAACFTGTRSTISVGMDGGGLFLKKVSAPFVYACGLRKGNNRISAVVSLYYTFHCIHSQ